MTSARSIPTVMTDGGLDERRRAIALETIDAAIAALDRGSTAYSFAGGGIDQTTTSHEDDFGTVTIHAWPTLVVVAEPSDAVLRRIRIDPGVASDDDRAEGLNCVQIVHTESAAHPMPGAALPGPASTRLRRLRRMILAAGRQRPSRTRRAEEADASCLSILGALAAIEDSDADMITLFGPSEHGPASIVIRNDAGRPTRPIRQEDHDRLLGDLPPSVSLTVATDGRTMTFRIECRATTMRIDHDPVSIMRALSKHAREEP